MSTHLANHKGPALRDCAVLALLVTAYKHLWDLIHNLALNYVLAIGCGTIGL